jgi:DNA polymerase-3 subunit alpha
VDPILHALSFEPFINAEKAKLPDLNIEVCYRRQSELVEYALTRFGPDRVARVPVETMRSKPETLKANPYCLLIGGENLAGNVPLCKDPETGTTFTQYSSDQLSECGWVKIGIFGLKALTVMGDLPKVPEDDQATFHLLGEGRSAGVFGFESALMRSALKELKPASIADLAALDSITRPYLMDSLPRFMDAKAGRREVSYPHPLLEPILKETYGMLMYHDQVARAAREIAGYSPTHADLLRRAMGKKKFEELERERALFREGAAQARALGHDEADAIFDFMVKGAGNCAGKSHAFARATLGYRLAYSKAHWPLRFAAARFGALFAQGPRSAAWPRFSGNLW